MKYISGYCMVNAVVDVVFSFLPWCCWFFYVRKGVWPCCNSSKG